jgi:hypothetical protein
VNDDKKDAGPIQERSVESHTNEGDSISPSGTETPPTLVATPALEGKGEDNNTAKEATPGPATEEKKVEKANEDKTSNEEKDDPKKRRGWPSRAPFYNSSGKRRSTEPPDEEKIYWSELTWNQQLAWRKAFVREYLSETKKCLPHVRKLFLMIYRISPWRAAVVLALNIVSGLLPALTLQTRGNFILMVYEYDGLADKSYNKASRNGLLTNEDC